MEHISDMWPPPHKIRQNFKIWTGNQHDAKLLWAEQGSKRDLGKEIMMTYNEVYSSAAMNFRLQTNTQKNSKTNLYFSCIKAYCQKCEERTDEKSVKAYLSSWRKFTLLKYSHVQLRLPNISSSSFLFYFSCCWSAVPVWKQPKLQCCIHIVLYHQYEKG